MMSPSSSKFPYKNCYQIRRCLVTSNFGICFFILINFFLFLVSDMSICKYSCTQARWLMPRTRQILIKHVYILVLKTNKKKKYKKNKPANKSLPLTEDAFIILWHMKKLRFQRQVAGTRQHFKNQFSFVYTNSSYSNIKLHAIHTWSK